MGRGIEAGKIFRNKKDREDFVQRLAELCRAAEGLIISSDIRRGVELPQRFSLATLDFPSLFRAFYLSTKTWQLIFGTFPGWRSLTPHKCNFFKEIPRLCRGTPKV
jgi:hypothetical protein